MYGYFRPYDANLTHRERQLFNSYYCRLCYCLRIIGGQTARFCTTYDGAIYSLILALQEGEEEPPVLPCERIGTKNLKHFETDERGLKLARLSLISFGEKFRDDEVDNYRLSTKIVSIPFRRSIKNAQNAEPLLAKISYEGTEKINVLQDRNAPLDEVFSAYGDMATQTFSQFINMTPQTEELIRSISEYNFLVDMVVDYADDYKNGAYNGLKKEGFPTFTEYYNGYYVEFTDLTNKITSRILNALYSVRDDSKIWNTLFKIIMRAIDVVLPSAIMGDDVGFHYFKDLFARIKANSKLKKDLKRLGLENEKN